MARYFFDFVAGDVSSIDDEGAELSDVDAAHIEALDALSQATRDIVSQGQLNQHFAIHVRDEFGSVLEITAVVGSRSLRKQ